MKVTINIDCTPEEARAFFGLPDLKPMQTRLMEEMEEQMKSNLHAMDPDALFKTWLPAGIQGFEQLQKAFWTQFGGGKKGSDD
ncbi:DUF6489 family protein [Magnetospira sp. QH-2]|uniref:DUF6489 family protein n=1 Tax=Magnetospira sp. (strain QH-2) TaxID=1288970 RepID=UPI0003E8147F|nr:DUF6489 family protein [Magnetospira sp. QH-2]CCQ75613.1 conserved protein of unknown function [Magnetospira sp. QH-2]